ncbi:type VI secretion system-associated FHA domain protein TagH [Sulfitobacter sabulilitoris]|uniref:Type VI secretion system-associated FHA domain protein TagH n=1 Tax=Sulfitobacter sabulilitoris TaxID=2562655 RepID=A0A5S3PIE9_9RHOB|nr:type VI secretion system-associated FHA domain protein TagH [Sulfitobacter sabulilitoris]TMM54137.1 type VI secretion system-associated FHA domain protein TagH [Sulfitobacter sabulilitoris]
MSVILHFQSTGAVPGNAKPFRMLGGSLTIGRSDQNDMVLPDPDKMISGRHCAIEDLDGNVTVIDFSTNGTFLNYGKMPLGKTPTPLNDGDILSIGAYELLVEIAPVQQAPLADPLQDLPVPGKADDMADFLDPLDSGSAGIGGGSDDDFLDDLLGGPTAGPSGVKRDQLGDDGLLPPLGEEDDDDFLRPARPEPDRPAQSSHSSALSDMIPTPAPATSTIPDDWDLDLPAAGQGADDQDDDPFAQPQEAPPVDPPMPQTVPPRAAGITPDGPQPAPGGPDAASRAFLDALGAGDLKILDDDLVETMTRLGGVLNTMIGGVREILMTRQSIKSEFRMQQTVISAGANNPLKFSVSVDQAIEAMTRPAVKGYLPAATAAEEALDDIKAHEVAMMTGMEAALKGVLARLEPRKLAERIAADSSLRSVLTNKKARYWDVFEAQYGEISDQAENDFHDLFSKEFSRAYQAQLDRLKPK